MASRVGLGNGHYISPWWWERGSLDFGENKRGDQSKLKTQKAGSLKTLEGFRGGPTQIGLEDEVIVWGGGGGDRESHQKLLGEITSKHSRGDRLNFTLFSLKSSPPPDDK